jgi:DNA-binding transcriptional MerR regulator
MFRIGDFSKLAQVSIRMLRHYDEMGVLKPARIDAETGYRYYAAAQMPRLNRILALQDLGFSIRQIAELLEQALSPEQLRGMLLQKQAELQDQVRAEQERLARVAARLHQMETPGSSYDIRLKEVPPIRVAAVRDTISGYGGVSYLFGQLFAHLPPYHIHGAPISIWHDDSHHEEGIDAEALIPVAEEAVGNGIVQVVMLAGGRMASVVHQGSYNRLTAAYDALLNWMEAGGYEIAGANREVYLHATTPVRPDDESYVTEILFPVQTVIQS